MYQLIEQFAGSTMAVETFYSLTQCVERAMYHNIIADGLAAFYCVPVGVTQ